MLKAFVLYGQSERPSRAYDGQIVIGEDRAQALRGVLNNPSAQLASNGDILINGEVFRLVEQTNCLDATAFASV